MQDDLVDDFARLRKLGIKFSANTLSLLAKDLIAHTEKQEYHIEMRSGRDDKRIKDLITPSWIQRFMNRYSIVTRRQTGKLQVSPEGQEKIDRGVAYFLGTIAKEFQSGQLDECNVDNADETHFLINMDNGRTLGFRGDEHVKCADVTCGGEGMTMMVRLSGGWYDFLAALTP